MLKLKSREKKIWFMSDPHFFHKNITRGVSEWHDKHLYSRDFPDVESMTYYMIDQINKYVGEDDILICLGDWSFGGKDKIWKARKEILCKTIYYIGGNHDMHIILNKELPNVCLTKEDWGHDYKRHFFCDIEKVEEADFARKVTAQEIFYYLGTSAIIQIDKILVHLSHFPCEDVRFDQPSIHLHGHNHAKPHSDKCNGFDCGMDNALIELGEYRPFSWYEIKQRFMPC